jgi:hypothetical protein
LDVVVAVEPAVVDQRDAVAAPPAPASGIVGLAGRGVERVGRQSKGVGIEQPGLLYRRT